MEIKKSTVLWIAIGILALAVLFLTMQVSSGDVSAVPAGASAAQSASSYGGMVGGC